MQPAAPGTGLLRWAPCWPRPLPSRGRGPLGGSETTLLKGTRPHRLHHSIVTVVLCPAFAWPFPLKPVLDVAVTQARAAGHPGQEPPALREPLHLLCTRGAPKPPALWRRHRCRARHRALSPAFSPPRGASPSSSQEEGLVCSSYGSRDGGLGLASSYLRASESLKKAAQWKSPPLPPAELCVS